MLFDEEMRRNAVLAKSLTKAQKIALAVLVQHKGAVYGDKYSSAILPRPHVNMIAAESLCKLRLARCAPWRPGRSPSRYIATDLGREIAAQQKLVP